MKFKFYNNITEFENDKTKDETDLAVVVRNGYIDCDVVVKAKTPYMAFKKVATQLAKYGYDDLKSDMTYRDDFLRSLDDKSWMEMVEYPNEQINGCYGYSIDEIGEELDSFKYYIRHFEPLKEV